MLMSLKSLFLKLVTWSYVVFITIHLYYPFYISSTLSKITLAGFGSFPRGMTHTFLSEGSESFGIVPGLDCGFPLTLIIGLGKHQETS